MNWISVKERLPDLLIENDPTGCFYSHTILFVVREPIANRENLDRFTGEPGAPGSETLCGRYVERPAFGGGVFKGFCDEVNMDDYRPEQVICWSPLPAPPTDD